jgi:prophage DNA circulation protein
MKVEDLHEASYRGAFFFIKGSEIEGGRKDAKKQFIGSDNQVIEDLGKKQRTFTLKGIIAERRDIDGNIISSYKSVRDTLITALEKGGTGTLIHPWYGRYDNIVCRTFSLSEKITDLGSAEISMKFEVSNSLGIPIPSLFVLTGISTKTADVVNTAISILSEVWEITERATGNFQAGIDKGTQFIDSVNAATRPIATLSYRIDEHTSLVNTFTSSLVTLVNTPVDLADSVAGVMDSINGLYETPNGTFEAFRNLFNFGETDIASPYSTLISLERNNNNDAFNSVVKSTALSYSYLNASQIEYNTVEEINENEAILEEQYQKVFRSEETDAELLDGITELRTTTQGFFNEQKLTASQIITVKTNPTSTRLLAYTYYGDSVDGETIAELNNLYDLAYQQGDIRIFTA